MFGSKSFLMIGEISGVNLLTLVKGGYEILNCDFSFQQGIDEKGKATTRVYSGAINLTLSQLPTNELIEWGLNGRKYLDGAIVLLNDENIPLQKIFFKNTACTSLDIRYTQSDDSYVATVLSLMAETIIVGDGIEFCNEWTI